MTSTNWNTAFIRGILQGEREGEGEGRQGREAGEGGKEREREGRGGRGGRQGEQEGRQGRQGEREGEGRQGREARSTKHMVGYYHRILTWSKKKDDRDLTPVTPVT